MFNYEKRLEYPVHITRTDPKAAMVIISQYGGPDGEAGAALRYLSQRYSMEDRKVAGALTDIGTEELGHLEIVATIIHQLTKDLTPEEIKEGLSDAVRTQIEDGTPLTDALVAASICKSKGDARRLIQQGSISVNGEKKNAIDFVLRQEDAVNHEFSIIRKGKKNWYLFTF